MHVDREANKIYINKVWFLCEGELCFKPIDFELQLIMCGDLWKAILLLSIPTFPSQVSKVRDDRHHHIDKDDKKSNGSIHQGEWGLFTVDLQLFSWAPQRAFVVASQSHPTNLRPIRRKLCKMRLNLLHHWCWGDRIPDLTPYQVNRYDVVARKFFNFKLRRRNTTS